MPVITERNGTEEELHRVNRALRVLSGCNQALVHTVEESAFLAEICRIIVGKGGYVLAWVGYVQQDKEKSVRPVAHAGFEEGYLEILNISLFDPKRSQGPTGTAIRTGKYCIANNIRSDPGFSPWRSQALKRGYSSSIALPLIADEKPFGAINIYAPEPDAFNKQEVDLMHELAGDLAYGITSPRTRAAGKVVEQALQKSEERLREVVQNMPVMMYALDENNNIITWNRECERVTGYTAGEIVDNPKALELLYPDAEYRDELRRKASTAGERPGDDYRNRELSMTCKDGTVRTVSWSDISGRFPIPGWVSWAVGLDITKKNKAIEKIKKLNEELDCRVKERTAVLEDANREMGSFCDSVSHDLRVPLRAIDGFSRILLEDYHHRLDDEGKGLLNIVRENTKKMGQLIDDLLAFSRMGRKVVKLSEINMEELARDVFKELKPDIAGRIVQLKMKSPPPCSGDKTLLRQVLINLLSNAIKFTRPKKFAFIEVGGKKKVTENIYYIRDNGVGLDPEYAEKAFGIFQRLHSEDKFEGTGVGLAIVKRIIHKHGGRVWIEGTINLGTTVYFSIPKRLNL